MWQNEVGKCLGKYVTSIWNSKLPAALNLFMDHMYDSKYQLQTICRGLMTASLGTSGQGHQ